MGRKGDPEEYEEPEAARFSGEEAFSDDFDDEPPRRPPVAKRGGTRRPKKAYEPSEEEDEPSEDDRKGKQIARREKPKKSKKQEKALVKAPKKKKQESSEEEEDDSDEEEVVKVQKYLPLGFEELHSDYVNQLSDILGLTPKKIGKFADKGLIRKHYQSGEFNIDKLLQKCGGEKEKKKYQKFVERCKGSGMEHVLRVAKRTKAGRVAATTRARPRYDGGYGGGGYGGYGGGYGATPYDYEYGHVYFDQGCPDCRRCGMPCSVMGM